MSPEAPVLPPRLLDSGGIETDGAVGAAASQQVEVTALAAGIGACIAEQHEIAVLTRDAVDAANDGGVERVTEVGDQGEGAPALARAVVEHDRSKLRHGFELKLGQSCQHRRVVEEPVGIDIQDVEHP